METRSTFLAMVFFCSLSLVTGIVGCGEDNDNDGNILEDLLERNERCNSSILQYYGTVSHINSTMMMCLPFRFMAPEYFPICSVFAALPYIVIEEMSYNSIAHACQCGNLWPDIDAIENDCRAACSEESFPCQFVCENNRINELNDSFWQCYDNGECMETCEDYSSSCISRCSKHDPFCIIFCLISDNTCHIECVDQQ